MATIDLISDLVNRVKQKRVGQANANLLEADSSIDPRTYGEKAVPGVMYLNNSAPRSEFNPDDKLPLERVALSANNGVTAQPPPVRVDNPNLPSIIPVSTRERIAEDASPVHAEQLVDLSQDPPPTESDRRSFSLFDPVIRPSNNPDLALKKKLPEVAVAPIRGSERKQLEIDEYEKTHASNRDRHRDWKDILGGLIFGFSKGLGRSGNLVGGMVEGIKGAADKNYTEKWRDNRKLSRLYEQQKRQLEIEKAQQDYQINAFRLGQRQQDEQFWPTLSLKPEDMNSAKQRINQAAQDYYLEQDNVARGLASDKEDLKKLKEKLLRLKTYINTNVWDDAQRDELLKEMPNIEP